MKTLEVTSLPEVFFSIINKNDSYDFILNPLHRCVEITYIAQGTLDFWIDKKKRQAHEGDVMCIIRNREIVVHSDEPICLHSFIMRLDYTYQENNGSFILEVFECIIPKGTKYFVGIQGDYASERIIFLEKIV